MKNAVMAVAVALSAAGCSILEDDVNRGFAQRDALTSATFTTADIRVITQRNRPVGNGYGGPVSCTEPTPDVAKALSAAAQLTASVNNKGNAAASGASAEAVAALAGRSTALLGLRDGLYRACEAYANGVIGADAYALVLSRYGQLMTTLFLGQDVTGAAGTEAGPAVQSPSVTVNVPGGTGVTAGPVPLAAAAPPPPPSQAVPPATIPSVAPVALARMNEDYLNLSYSLDGLIVACTNYYDPTRLHAALYDDKNKAYVTYPNNWLQGICSQLQSQMFSGLPNAVGRLVAEHVLASPVNPGITAAPATPAQPAKSVAAAATNFSEGIKAVQTRLREYCADLKVDGKLGPDTMACALKNIK